MSEDHRSDRRNKLGHTRRAFLAGAGGIAAGGIVGSHAEASAEPRQAGPARLAGDVEVELDINGERRKVVCRPRTTLLEALRNRCEPALTGTKLVCDRGSCGACTVLVDGEPVCSCLMLAVDARGRRIRTVEGLASGGSLSPVQEAFVEKDALMCGFCTPGFVMSVTGCLEKDPGASLAEIKTACAGNLCRCGTYPHVFEAAVEAGRRMRGGKR